MIFLILSFWVIIGIIGWVLKLVQTSDIPVNAEDVAMLFVCAALGPISLCFVLADIL